MDSLITIITFAHIHEAYIAQTKLESEGIDVYLKDDIMATNYLLAVGGAKLQINSKDYEEAREILLASGYTLD